MLLTAQRLQTEFAGDASELENRIILKSKNSSRNEA